MFLMNNRVVITGMGCVSPLGLTADKNWTALIKGESGIKTVDKYLSFPSKVFGLVPPFSPRKLLDDEALPLTRWMTRPMLLFFIAVRQALQESGLLTQNGLNRKKIGIIGGTTANYPVRAQEKNLLFYYQYRDQNEIDWHKIVSEGAYSPYQFCQQTTNLLTCLPALFFKLLGPNLTVHNACASGTQTVGEAFRMVRAGRVEAMLAGGAESLTNLTGISILTRLGVLSSNSDAGLASRPFDAQRDGLVLAEGAAVLVIENLDSATKRGADVLAEIVGFGSSTNAFRITDVQEDGRGAYYAMRSALQDAELNPDSIQAINAHGTSTPQNDISETFAIKRALGTHAYRIPVYAIKSMTGHALSASGTIELVASVFTLQTGIVPPTINYTNKDPQCDLFYVPGEAIQVSIQYLMKNSFGFGGQNGCLVLRRWEGERVNALSAI